MFATSNSPASTASVSVPANSFAALFQSRTSASGVTFHDITELLDVVDTSYLAQSELKTANVEKIVKSVVKDRWLMKHPSLAVVPSERLEMLGGGRHRLAAIRTIIDSYGINAKGKCVLRTDDNESELTDIAPIIAVQTFTFNSKRDMVQWLQADNGSRSMTAFEKSLGEAYSGSITPLAKLKLSVADRLVKAIDAAGLPYSLTEETALNAVKMAFTALGTNAKFMTDEQGTLLVNFIVEAAETTKIDATNMAREGYKQLVNAALNTESIEPVYDADGDEVVNVDNAGNESAPTVGQWFATQFKAPAKPVRKTKTSELEDKVAALTALLASQGINAEV